MMSIGAKRTRTVLVGAALLAALPVLTACGKAPAAEQKQAAQPRQTIEVHITDEHLEMTDSLPSGATTFHVVNSGAHPHGFGIAGPAGDKTLDNLAPGGTADLEMDLEEGTYRVYCPLEHDHTDSMQLALHVHPNAPAPATSKS